MRKILILILVFVISIYTVACAQNSGSNTVPLWDNWESSNNTNVNTIVTPVLSVVAPDMRTIVPCAGEIDFDHIISEMTGREPTCNWAVGTSKRYYRYTDWQYHEDPDGTFWVQVWTHPKDNKPYTDGPCDEAWVEVGVHRTGDNFYTVLSSKSHSKFSSNPDLLKYFGKECGLSLDGMGAALEATADSIEDPEGIFKIFKEKFPEISFEETAYDLGAWSS